MNKKLSPLVVGYKGEIGSFILQGLLRVWPKAVNIYCFDVNDTYKDRIERIKKSDIIFLCVPMEETVNWLIKYKRFLKKKIIFEQTSLKGIIFDDKRFKEISHLNIRMMHILFKPSMTPKEDRSLALIKPINVMDIHNMIVWEEFVWDFVHMFDMKKENIEYHNSWERHDAIMATQQALVHKVLLLLDKFNNNCGGKRNTYLSKKIEELTLRIKLGNKDMYKLIQNNPKLKAINKLFLELFEKFKIEDYL